VRDGSDCRWFGNGPALWDVRLAGKVNSPGTQRSVIGVKDAVYFCRDFVVHDGSVVLAHNVYAEFLGIRWGSEGEGEAIGNLQRYPRFSPRLVRSPHLPARVFRC
jgi:hypothetical protein